MKRIYIFMFAALLIIGPVESAPAETYGPISIYPGLFYFIDGGLAYPNTPDYWQFDFSSYPNPVAITLQVNDAAGGLPMSDDYGLSWDGAWLGRTITSTNEWRVFHLTPSPGLHTLTVEYLNMLNIDTGEVFPPDSGGSYYEFRMDMSQVPIPGTVWLLGSGLLGLVGWRHFRKS